MPTRRGIQKTASVGSRRIPDIRTVSHHRIRLRFGNVRGNTDFRRINTACAEGFSGYYSRNRNANACTRNSSRCFSVSPFRHVRLGTNRKPPTQPRNPRKPHSRRQRTPRPETLRTPGAGSRRRRKTGKFSQPKRSLRAEFSNAETPERIRDRARRNSENSRRRTDSILRHVPKSPIGKRRPNADRWPTLTWKVSRRNFPNAAKSRMWNDGRDVPTRSLWRKLRPAIRPLAKASEPWK